MPLVLIHTQNNPAASPPYLQSSEA